jgi:hypothetical protein
VAVALLPLAFNALRLRTLDPAAIFGRGELLLVTAALTAAAIGDLLGPEDSQARVVGKLFIGGGCVVELVLASAWVGDISAALRGTEGASLDPGHVASMSGVLFAFAVAAGGSAKVLSQE